MSVVGGSYTSTTTTLEQLLALSAPERRADFGWILERSTGHAQSFMEDATEEDDVWDAIAAPMSKEQRKNVPVCAESCRDVALYLQTLDYWAVPWHATPVPLLDQILGAPDRNDETLHALTEYAAELQRVDDKPRTAHVRRLEFVRAYSSDLRPASVGAPRVISDRLEHALRIFANEKGTCASDLEFALPWLESWVPQQDPTLHRTQTLEEAAGFVAQYHLPPELMECPPLFAWFVPRATSDKVSRVVNPTKLVRAVLSRSSLAGLEVLRDTFTANGMSSDKLERVVEQASGLPFGHKFSARFIDVLHEMWPGMLQSTDFIFSVLTHFKSADKGMDGAIELMRRMASAGNVGRVTADDLAEVAQLTMENQFQQRRLPGEFVEALLALADATMPVSVAVEEKRRIRAEFFPAA